MDDAVDDGIGHGGISEIRVPGVTRQLAGNDRRTGPVPVLQDLEQVLPLPIPDVEVRDLGWYEALCPIGGAA